MTFYPDDRPVPAELRTEDLYLEMLAPKHVDLDYEAFMSSWPRLQIWGGGGWPHADFTLEENLDDMHGHMEEFLNREAFAYTVMNADQTRVEGCIYINPLTRQLTAIRSDEAFDVGNDEAVVTYWVRDDALERDLDRQLLAGLLVWLQNEWQFSKVYFMVNRNQVRDIAELEAAGLERAFTVEGERNPGRFYFYGAESLNR